MCCLMIILGLIIWTMLFLVKQWDSNTTTVSFFLKITAEYSTEYFFPVYFWKCLTIIELL